MNARQATGRVLPELELCPGTRFIADLHLDAADAAACTPFVAWIERLTRVPTIAILGDLFDVWVGPAQARMPGAATVLDALGSLVRRGTQVIVVPGNRDFLLEASFEERTHALIHREGFVGRIDRADRTERVLCVHGDTLCTLDTAYQRLRSTLRSAPVQWIGPRLPLWAGTAIARRLRRASVRAIAAKLPEEKSLQESAARALSAGHRADVVVCGHAHSFRDIVLESGPRWIVLDAFGGARDLLRVGEDGDLACEASGVASARWIPSSAGGGH